MNYLKAEAKSAARAQFRGVWAAMTAPFTRDFELDEEGFRPKQSTMPKWCERQG
jgi:hypothetical protein